MNILIRDAYIITMDKNDSILEKANVYIQNGEILYLGTLEIQDFVPQRVIDASGCIVMPGLINMHTHVPMTLFRGAADDLPLHRWLFEKIFPMEDKLNAEYVYIGTKLAINEMLRRGITTFSDMYFFSESIAQAVSETGIRADISRAVMDAGGGSSNRLYETRELFRKWHNTQNGRITVRTAAHAVYTCSSDTLIKCCDLSDELGIGMHIHVSETVKELTDCIHDNGMSPVEYLYNLGVFNRNVIAAHCVAVDDNDIEILAKSKVNVIHNPTSNLKLASGFSPIPKMLQRGINIALGTDGAASNNTQNIFREIFLTAIIHKGFSSDASVIEAYSTLKMATKNGAIALGRDDIGSLETGKKADIIIIDECKAHFMPNNNRIKNLVYASTGEEVLYTIVDGKILYENGIVNTIDTEELYKKSQQIARDIIY